MTDISKKIDEQFNSLSISAITDSKKKLNLYADYIELVCLTSNEYVSESDIIDRLIDSGVVFKTSKRELDGEFGQIDAEVYDTEESWIVSVFEYLKIRKELFAESYPFVIENNKIKLLTKEIGSPQYLYLFLLITSSLRFFKKLIPELTTEFELISEEALKTFLPQATVYGFGSNSHYKGNAKNKILELAKDIKINDINKRIINQISEYNSKEEGLDIVGWIPFNNNPNTIIILGQCATGNNWQNKQNETKRYDRFYNHYLLPFIHTLFIPYEIHNYNGVFQYDKDINNNTLVFERSRLIDLLNGYDFNDNLKSKQIIDKLISFQEDIV